MADVTDSTEPFTKARDQIVTAVIEAVDVSLQSQFLELFELTEELQELVEAEEQKEEETRSYLT